MAEARYPLVLPTERSVAYRNWMDLLTTRFNEALPFSGPIDTALTLGSGVSGALQHFALQDIREFSFSDIGLPEGANQHHPKKIIAGTTPSGKKLVAFTGRTAAFEISPDGIETETGHVQQMEAATAYLEMVNRVGSENLILTPNGVIIINSLPSQALDGVQPTDKPTTIQSAVLGAQNGEAYYDVKGIQERKFIGLVPVRADVETKIDAQNGSIITVDKPWYLNLLGFLYTI